jgi:hypothetical protein
MNWHAITTFAPPLLDAAVIVLLAAVLVRLRRDPSEAWAGYEARLRELQENLRLLVAQAEGEAHELDRRLAAHAERLRHVSEAAPPPPAAAPAAQRAAGTSLPDHVRRLVAAGLPIGEIARRLSMPVAEARILAGLSVGGATHARQTARPLAGGASS